jgi:hypothetical protein
MAKLDLKNNEIIYKGIQPSVLIPKDVLEPFKSLSVSAISKKIQYSKYKIKKSLLAYGWYSGVSHTQICEMCSTEFKTFAKGY